MSTLSRLVGATLVLLAVLVLMLTPIDALRSTFSIDATSATYLPAVGVSLSVIVHVLLFAVVGIVLPLLLLSDWRILLLVALTLGLGTEALQVLTHTRVAKWEDAAVNIISVALGLLVGLLLRNQKNPSNTT